MFKVLVTYHLGLLAKKMVAGSSRITATLGLTTFEYLVNESLLKPLVYKTSNGDDEVRLETALQFYNEVHRCIRNKDPEIQTSVRAYIKFACMVCYYAQTYGM